MVLQHRQQNDVRLVGGQCGVDAINEGFHGLADRWRPQAVDAPVVAAGALKVELDLPREPSSVERKSRYELTDRCSWRRVGDVHNGLDYGRQ